MSISQARFAALVEAAATNHYKVVSVTVTGFGFDLTLKSRRTQYDVHAFYDQATDHWTLVDPYRGGTLHAIVNEIDRAMRT